MLHQTNKPMTNKFLFIIMLSCACFITQLHSQTAPIKHFALALEQTNIATDSLGETYFYSVRFESNVDTMRSATFNLRSSANDSIVNKQVFNLPIHDGVYQTGSYPNGLIKDKNSFFILLGNVKAKAPLYLTSEFIDSKNTLYTDILTNE